MNKKTLIALNASIEKWEKRANGDHSQSPGMHNCPLCRLFHENFKDEEDDKESCQGCPVYERTGYSYCEETPYTAYYFHRTNANAHAELDFLKSLLPVKEEKKEAFKWVDLDSLSNVAKS